MNFRIIDTTFRDGQQSPLLMENNRYRFDLADKKEIVVSLIDLGVRDFEMFSPVVSKNEYSDFIKLKRFVRNYTTEKINFIAHVRCNMKDIKSVLRAGFNGLNIFIGTSDESIRSNHGKKIDEIKRLTKKIISEVRFNNPNIFIRFSGEDAFRTDFDKLIDIFDNIASFVDAFGIPDTVGIANRDEIKRRINTLKQRFPNILIEGHFHNDLGNADSNAAFAIENGLDLIDTSIWGIAERNGITSITSLLFILDRSNINLDQFSLRECMKVNTTLSKILDTPIPYRELISKRNRVHISGVHQNAVNNENDTYEAYDFERFGIEFTESPLNCFSGWHTVRKVLIQNGYFFEENIIRNITRNFKDNLDKLTQDKGPKELLLYIAEKYQNKVKVFDLKYKIK
jgi:homocitrate synthase